MPCVLSRAVLLKEYVENSQDKAQIVSEPWQQNKGLPNKVTSFPLKKKRDAILFFIYY